MEASAEAAKANRKQPELSCARELQLRPKSTKVLPHSAVRNL